MPNIIDRLLGRDKEEEKKNEAPQRVSEEAARKRREELAARKKEMEEARKRAEAAEKERLAKAQATAAKADLEALAEKEKAELKAKMESLKFTKPSTAAAERTYVVKSGDSLSKIAKELYGDAKRWPEIYEANKELIGENPNLIHPGQELRIP